MNIIKNIQEPLLELSEVAIIPSKQTKIHSRTQECDARTSDDKLPIFISPMDSVINEGNFDLFNKDFYAIYPRTIDFHTRLHILQAYDDRWIAFGLNEIKTMIKMIDSELLNLMGRVHICIDQANGHMEDVITYGKMLRERLATKDSEIMIGNIANPRTITTIAYNDFADWVRIGIGGGSVCTTSVQTGVHYPMASLIAECHFYKSTFEFGNKRPLKIVADGGIGDSGDICKALALGADAVMCGRMFVAVEESASPYLWIMNNNGEMDEGYNNRTIGSTLMNATSSRAHTIVTIEFRQIKEKFGGLRVYVNFHIKELDELIDKAEQKSFSVCEKS